MCYWLINFQVRIDTLSHLEAHINENPLFINVFRELCHTFIYVIGYVSENSLRSRKK